MLSKKNLKVKADKDPDWLLGFFDESRFGTHSKLGHGWFIKGKRSGVKVKLGFKNFYVYSMINPIDGEHFSLLASSVDTDCMNIFLDRLSQDLGSRRMLLVMDQASWHKSKSLKVPNNIKIELLPPYSPELNPVERLWGYMKSKLIRNKLYDNLDELEEAVCAFLRQLKGEVVQSICKCDYLN